MKNPHIPFCGQLRRAIHIAECNLKKQKKNKVDSYWLEERIASAKASYKDGFGSAQEMCEATVILRRN
jgi:hypothetical protein